MSLKCTHFKSVTDTLTQSIWQNYWYQGWIKAFSILKQSLIAIQIIFNEALKGKKQILELLFLKSLDLPEESQHKCRRRKAVFYRGTKGGRDPNP